jgi:hypothetical protein
MRQKSLAIARFSRDLHLKMRRYTPVQADQVRRYAPVGLTREAIVAKMAKTL